MAELLLHNADVYTMDPARPRAGAVAVRDGRIVAVGADAASALGSGAERIDCRAGVLVPAFIDAHCHLLSYAASLRSVDCTSVRSIVEIQRAIAARVMSTPPGRWVRAFGYEETSLAEGRHPTRADLDAVAPAHPVRLIHRSGHASVLNSVALRELGMTIESEEPAGASIERDLSTGEPNGVLIEMEDAIDRAVPRPPYEDVADMVREASQRLLRAGVVCIQDASHSNGPDEWRLFERLIEDGALAVDVVLMEGWQHFAKLPERGAAGRLRRGPVKIMLRELGGAFAPDEPELTRIVGEAHAAGRQVAIHAVSEEAVSAAVRAIGDAVRRAPREHRHRIEHCSQLPEGLAAEIARLGIVVVSQPSLVYERGDRYLALVPEQQIDRLYAFRTLSDAGVRLAASSDAPVTAPHPLASIAAAVDRRSASGRAVAPDQAVAANDALAWWTAGAAFAAGLEAERGSIQPGLLADLALLPPNALTSPAVQLRELAPERIWRAGSEVRFEAAILDR